MPSTAGTIYLLSKDGQLAPLYEQPYESEALLQKLLADHPSLLAGEQMDTAQPRRWLLITREAPVPGDEDASWRWSVDHLFLDQDGVPTLVEVKRSSDTRIRREVIGQMLDYAANAALYVPVEKMKELLERRCAKENKDAAAEVAALLGEGAEVDAFWQNVKTNLQAKRLRMVFLADEIPTELRVIVEFLNEQMDPAEVLAVEVKQFVGSGMTTLVPRVIGQSAAAEQKKSAGGPVRQWNEGSFFAELAKRGPAEVAAARRMLEWAKGQGLTIFWGRGQTSGSFTVGPMHKGQQHYGFAVWTYGAVEIQFQWMLGKEPFGAEQKCRELLARLNGVPGVAIPEEAIGRRPSVKLGEIDADGAIQAFLGIWSWFVDEIRAT